MPWKENQMYDFGALTSYLKEVAGSLKFQASAALTFGAALLMLWLKENSEFKIALTILFLFPTCMLLGSLVEKGFDFWRKKKEKRAKRLKRKLGLLGEHHFTHRPTELWKDKNFEGLGWQVYVDCHSRSAYLTHPSCFECKTDLIARTNSKCDGFVLECPDCKKRFDVDDIGEKRNLADASFKGEVRRNPNSYF